MTVLVDTPVWSLAFRRHSPDAPEAVHLTELIRRKQVAIIGPIRQEVLSGIRSAEHFAQVRDRLRSFVDLTLSITHFERAAEFYNACRRSGVQGSHADFLICAVAESEGFPIYTTDVDFTRYAEHLPIDLYGTGGRSA